jgi:peptide/nickel transport system permease protein
MARESQLPEYARTGASLPTPIRSVLRGPIAVYDLLRRYPIVWTVVFGLLVVLAAFAPLIASHDPIRDADFSRVRNPPVWLEGGTSEFWLGTDQVGRDLWSRLLYGGRASLMVVAVGMTSGMIIGTALGLAAGFIGGIIDEIIMRLVDAWIALPFIMIALVIKIVLGTSFTIMFLILILISWVGFVRPVRGEVLSLRERDYVASARVAGASGFRIAMRHILPGVSSTVIVLATLGAGGLVLAESTLSYLGVGIPQPTPTWGNMIADGRDYLDTAWWISTMPGIAIFLLVLSLNFTGDWLRDRWDPKLRQL